VSPFAWDIAIFARDRALSAAQTDRLVKELDLILLDFRGHSETATERGRWVEWPDKV